jgi:hypothetical protein
MHRFRSPFHAAQSVFSGLRRVSVRFSTRVAFGLSCLIGAPALLPAQELRLQPTPFSVTLDFQRPSSKPSYPIWLESVEKTQAADVSAPRKTTQRLRLRRLGQLNAEIQLRLFFEDLPGRTPVVSGYTETGRQLYVSPALGAGLSLPTSESLCIPVLELDYLEITVPGDGSNLLGAFLCTLAKSQVRHALDFEPPAKLQDPFANASGKQPLEDDAFLSGRVRATLSNPATPCAPGAPALFEFTLERVPEIAVFRFEVLGADPVHTPEMVLNEHAAGNAALQLPDLADPAYLFRREATQNQPRFEYAGWVSGHYAVPGSALKAGLNQLWIVLPEGALTGVIRALTLDLKYPATQFRNPNQP